MDGSKRAFKSHKFATVGVLGLLMFLSSAQAIILSSPPSPNSEIREKYEDESFPESRFGSPPTPLNLRSTEYSDRKQLGRSPASSELIRKSDSNFQENRSASTQVMHSDQIPIRVGVQEVALIASDLGYFPKTILATRDIPVRLFITGASKKPLCIMMDKFGVQKQIQSQKIQEIEIVPTTAGQFRFYCPLNGMEGTLLVREPGVASLGLPAEKGD